MVKDFLDRGAPIEGIERTARDSRVPFPFPRRMSNLALPDKRLARRPGFKKYIGTTQRNILSKHTGSTITAKLNDDPISEAGGFVTRSNECSSAVPLFDIQSPSKHIIEIRGLSVSPAGITTVSETS